MGVTTSGVFGGIGSVLILRNREQRQCTELAVIDKSNRGRVDGSRLGIREGTNRQGVVYHFILPALLVNISACISTATPEMLDLIREDNGTMSPGIRPQAGNTASADPNPLASDEAVGLAAG